MASQEMDGKELKGLKIKTKRHQEDINRSNSPAHDLKTKNTNTPNKDPKKSSQKADLIDSDKLITDCYYFILNGVCKPKQGQVCFYYFLVGIKINIYLLFLFAQGDSREGPALYYNYLQCET